MQKGVCKDVHLLANFMESREYHRHAFLIKGVNPLVSQRLVDVYSKVVVSLWGILVLDYPKLV